MEKIRAHTAVCVLAVASMLFLPVCILFRLARYVDHEVAREFIEMIVEDISVAAKDSPEKESTQR